MRYILILAAIAAVGGLAAAQGPTGSALQFDGVDDWVDFGTGPSTTTTFTLEAWVKPTRATASAQFVAGPHGAQQGCFQGAGFVQFGGSDTEPGSLSFVVGYQGCGNDDVILGPVPTLGEWVHLAGTYDGSTMQFYIDGSLVGERTGVDYTAFNRLVAGSAYDNRAGAPVNFFAGEIDELRLWDYVRTADEIDGGRSQTMVGNETGLVACWNFDEGGGQAVQESVAGVYDGRLGNDADPMGDEADPTWIAIAPPVKTPAEAIEDLLATVRGMNLRAGLERCLVAKLEVALRKLRDGVVANDRAAVRALRAFIATAMVRGRLGREIPAVQSTGALIAEARRIIEEIEGGLPQGACRRGFRLFGWCAQRR